MVSSSEEGEDKDKGRRERGILDCYAWEWMWNRPVKTSTVTRVESREVKRCDLRWKDTEKAPEKERKRKKKRRKLAVISVNTHRRLLCPLNRPLQTVSAIYLALFM